MFFHPKHQRRISDEVCRDFGFSVIENPIGKGVSHYDERDMQKEGKSWKEKLRHKLLKIIFKSEDFDDFLRRCGKKNIEVVYTPEKKVKLKFRMEGQQRFVRADTLGEDYLPEKITENIALIKQAEAAIAEREALLAASKPVTETAPVTPKAEPTIEQKPIIEPVTAPLPPEPESVVIQPVNVPEKPFLRYLSSNFDALRHLSGSPSSISSLVNISISESSNKLIIACSAAPSHIQAT